MSGATTPESYREKTREAMIAAGETNEEAAANELFRKAAQYASLWESTTTDTDDKHSAKAMLAICLYFLGDGKRAEKLAQEVTIAAKDSFYAPFVLFMIAVDRLSQHSIGPSSGTLWIDIPALLFGAFRGNQKQSSITHHASQMVSGFRNGWAHSDYDHNIFISEATALLRDVAPIVEKLKAKSVLREIYQSILDAPVDRFQALNDEDSQTVTELKEQASGALQLLKL